MGYSASHINTNDLFYLCGTDVERYNYSDWFIINAEIHGLKIERCEEDAYKRSNVFEYMSDNAKRYIYFTGGKDWWAFSKSIIESLKKDNKDFELVIQANSFESNDCHFWVVSEPNQYSNKGRITFQERPRGHLYSSPQGACKTLDSNDEYTVEGIFDYLKNMPN